MERVLLIGLDESEVAELKARLAYNVIVRPTLPKLFVERGGGLYVERSRGIGYLPIKRVVFHGIFADDLDLFAGLALWKGPCFPNPHALMDLRLRVPCLVKSLDITRFGETRRAWAFADTPYHARELTVAKWGNWHCGENKTRFEGSHQNELPALFEEFIEGESVRIICMGEQVWQVHLKGSDWRKSIHDPEAHFMEPDPELVEDAQNLTRGLGLPFSGIDYMIGNDGRKHLLEVNHIPSITCFPEVRQAYLDMVVAWCEREV